MSRRNTNSSFKLILQFTWQPYIYPTTLTKEEILESHRSVLCSFRNFNQRWRTGFTINLLESQITQVSFRTALYCWVCQMLHETSFQIINMHSIGGQNRASELLWYYSYLRGGVNQMWIFWLTTYLLCLVDVFFNRQSASLWVQTVLLFSLTCSFIHTFVWGRLHTGASQEKRKEDSPIL